jgi:GAF domain-containing protein
LGRTKSGLLFDVSITAAPFRDASGKVAGASRIVRDITTTKQREREVTRISRLYEAFSHINAAIVNTPARGDLLDKVCRALVEHGGFSMSWIGWRTERSNRLVPLCSQGDDRGYLDNVLVLTDEKPQDRDPTGTAFCEGRPYVCNDVNADLTTGPWRSEASQRGYLAAAAFPILEGGQVRGALTVYASEAGFFGDREVALLEEAVRDLSFRLDGYARDEARRVAEETVRRERDFDALSLHRRQSRRRRAALPGGCRHRRERARASRGGATRE